MKGTRLLAGHRKDGISTKGYRDDTLFDFPVSRERLHLSNGQETSIDALYRGDTGEFLSSVSPKYVVTTHAEANSFIEELLTKQSIQYEIGHTSVASHGNKFFREYRFPSLKFNPSGAKNTALDGGASDEYCPTIIARNSYDRSSTLDFYYGGFRYICKNGIVFGDIMDHYSIKHNLTPDYKVISDGFLDRIEATVENFKRNYIRLNSEAADLYLQTLMLEVFSKRASFALQLMSNGLVTLDYDSDGEITGATASKELSAYALMNLATAVATHNVRKFHTAIALQKQVSQVFQLS